LFPSSLALFFILFHFSFRRNAYVFVPRREIQFSPFCSPWPTQMPWDGMFVRIEAAGCSLRFSRCLGTAKLYSRRVRASRFLLSSFRPLKMPNVCSNSLSLWRLGLHHELRQKISLRSLRIILSLISNTTCNTQHGFFLALSQPMGL
jgi:hypothetical protein